MRTRVSSCMRASAALGAVAHAHVGAADPHRGAVADLGLLDPLTVDECAVGRAEVCDGHRGMLAIAGHAELDVPPADTGVVDPQVGLGTAAEHEPRGCHRMGAAVDL